MNVHPQFEEDFELYALGVLDGDDRAEIEAHLPRCPECSTKLSAARGLVAKLALAAPVSEPSAELRERVLECFREEHPGGIKAAPPLRAQRGGSKSFWGWALAAACLILFVVGGWLGLENRRLSSRLAELESRYKELEASNIQMKAVAARAEAVLEILTGSQTIQVDLAPSNAPPVPHGKAFYNHAHGLLFYTTNLNLLPRDRTYELWLIPTEGKPVDIGIFNADPQGNGQVILPSLPQGLTAKAFAVTIEPAGGVPAPTGPMVLVGPVS